jgi:hypothetical protein
MTGKLAPDAKLSARVEPPGLTESLIVPLLYPPNCPFRFIIDIPSLSLESAAFSLPIRFQGRSLLSRDLRVSRQCLVDLARGHQPSIVRPELERGDASLPRYGL